MSNAPTQPQLPLSKNGQLGLRRKRRRCGYCGFNVTINKNRTMRSHGPSISRCMGSGVTWTPVVHRSVRFGGFTKVWGTCGICGDLTEFPDLPNFDHFGERAKHEPITAKYLKRHDHERPHIRKERETGRWVMAVTSHRSGVSLTIECDTQQEAHAKAVELIELQK